MLEKLRKALGLSEKIRREREINWIGYSEHPSRLVIVFSDGSTRTHLNVIPGHIVGLRVAADKLDYYETQIAPSNLALEIAGARAIATTSTRANIHIRPGTGPGAIGLAAMSAEAQGIGAQSMKAKAVSAGSMNMGARAAAPEKRRAQF